MSQPRPPQYPPPGSPGGQYGGQHPDPQGGQYQPPAGYELKKKKKRKWPWVVGAILLLIVLVAAIGGGNSGQPGSTAQPDQQAAPGAQPGNAQSGGQGGGGITYEVVSGNGKGSAMITYTSSKNFNQSQENGAKLPWRKSVDLGGSFFTGASVIAQAGQGVNSITCRVKDGNEVLSENTSTGQFAVVTCSGN